MVVTLLQVVAAVIRTSVVPWETEACGQGVLGMVASAHPIECSLNRLIKLSGSAHGIVIFNEFL